MAKVKRVTFDGNFCDIACCRNVPGGSYCESGSCSQRVVWERLKQIEDIISDEKRKYDPELLRVALHPERHSIGKMDINGVEIFEGDVILLDGEKYTITCEHLYGYKKGSCSFSLSCFDISKAEVLPAERSDYCVHE